MTTQVHTSTAQPHIEQGFGCSLQSTYPQMRVVERSGVLDKPNDNGVEHGVLRKKRRKKQIEEKPYMCNICDATFKHSSSQKTHEIAHILDKAFNCEECGLTFAYKGNLKKHKLIHTGEKPYMCNVCGVHFTQSSAMKTHARIHTGEKPYHCSTCDKIFRNKGNLNKHERTHTGLKPFICHDCNKAFTQSSTLKIHRRIHTGERPYSCNDCDASFTCKGSLEHHKRKSCYEKQFMELGGSEPSSSISKKEEHVHACDCYYPMNLADGMLAAQRKSDDIAAFDVSKPTPSSSVEYTSAFTAVDSKKDAMGSDDVKEESM